MVGPQRPGQRQAHVPVRLNLHSQTAGVLQLVHVEVLQTLVWRYEFS